MNGVTLKHLRYFDALARLGHFGRAAQACGITQPALSMQIKELEAMFGAALVERSTRRVRLTAPGEQLLARAKTILNTLEEIDDLARAAKGPLAGSLRLGVIPTIAPYVLPQVIKALAEKLPGLDLRPREAITSKLIDDLLISQLDMAIVALPISEPALEEHALFEEEFVLIRPAGDAGEPIPSPEELPEMRLLLLAEGHCFRDQALSFCRSDGAPARVLMEGSSLSTLVQMVGAGVGVTLIPEMALAVETRSAHVCADRFAPPRPTRKVGVVWRKTNPLAEQYAMIGEIVRSPAGLPTARRPSTLE